MKNSLQTFGQTIYAARKKKPYKLSDLASMITKEDGVPITHQYLSELENDRCNPPSDRIILELARVLEISASDLFMKAKRYPPWFNLEDARHVAAVRVMLNKLEETRRSEEAAAA